MKSITTPDFWRAYAELSPKMQKKVRKAYLLWQGNSTNSSLPLKKVEIYQMLKILKRSPISYLYWVIPLGIIFATTEIKPVFAECNFYGCSQSTAAECNFYGCPKPPLGGECNYYGCPPSPQAQPKCGGTASGIITCMQGLLYRTEKVCIDSNAFSRRCIEYKHTLVRTEISESTAALACQNAR